MIVNFLVHDVKELRHIGDHMASKYDNDTAVESKSETKIKRPSLYKVLIHNDNYTTRDFVVDVLRQIFRHSEYESEAIMLHVHNSGVGIAGVYTFEIAESKVKQTENLARQHEFPLKLTMESEDK